MKILKTEDHIKINQSFANKLASGVARGVAGVAEATPIFQNLFNKFGQKIWTKNIVFTAGYTNLKILPTSLSKKHDFFSDIQINGNNQATTTYF